MEEFKSNCFSRQVFFCIQILSGLKSIHRGSCLSVNFVYHSIIVVVANNFVRNSEIPSSLLVSLSVWLFWMEPINCIHPQNENVQSLVHTKNHYDICMTVGKMGLSIKLIWPRQKLNTMPAFFFNTNIDFDCSEVLTEQSERSHVGERAQFHWFVFMLLHHILDG